LTKWPFGNIFNAMAPEVLLVLAIVLGAIVLFATEVISIDLTAMAIMVTLMLTGLVSPQEGIAGFSNPATVTVLALFILSAGLQATGAVNLLGRYMINRVGRDADRALFLTMLVVGVVSAFINNTAVVVIFLPIVFRIAKFTRSTPAKFLMPLSFAAMVGGASTLIGTTTNILVSEIYAETPKGESFRMFEFSSIGITLLVAYFLYMQFIGKRLITDRQQDESLTEQYNLKDYLTEVIVTPGSSLAGKHVRNTFLIDEIGADILEIQRKRQPMDTPEPMDRGASPEAQPTAGAKSGPLHPERAETGNPLGIREMWLPSRQEVLQEGDRIILKVNVDDIIAIQDHPGVKLAARTTLDDEDLESGESMLLEVVVAPNSKLARRSVREVNFRGMYGAVPLAIRRRGTFLRSHISDVMLRFGDDILLETRKDRAANFKRTNDFILLQEIEKPVFNRRKLSLSVAIVVGVVLVASFNLAPILVASLTGCVLLFLTECLTIREAYRSVEWKIIFLLAGLIPLGTAFHNSGAAELITDNLYGTLGQYGPTAIAAVLFGITSMLTSIMSNQATAVLIAPVALGLAAQLGIDPKGFLITIMFAANTSFVTPVGYQTNTLIYGPGNYRFSDFFKVGGLLTLVVWAIVTAMVHVLYLS
jgi:di/tricarboxylate transporter